MKRTFTLLLGFVFALSLQAQVCTLDDTNKSLDFCTACSAGSNPALVGNTFNGKLILGRNVDYSISAACLSGITFSGTLEIEMGFKTSLVFELDPIIDLSTFVSAVYTHHQQSADIIAFGKSYTPTGTAGLNYTDFALDAMGSAASFLVLPVELTRYTAHASTDRVAVEWETAAETDNAYYTVEHSFDGVEFVEAARIEPQYQEGAKLYSYLHRPARTGVQYYRLAQYDQDGTRHDLGIRTAVTQQSGSTAEVYPNPALAGQRLTVNGFSSAAPAELYTIEGTLVQTFSTQDDDQQYLDLPSDLTAGLYILRQGTAAHRIVVR